MAQLTAQGLRNVFLNPQIGTTELVVIARRNTPWLLQTWVRNYYCLDWWALTYYCITIVMLCYVVLCGTHVLSTGIITDFQARSKLWLSLCAKPFLWVVLATELFHRRLTNPSTLLSLTVQHDQHVWFLLSSPIFKRVANSCGHWY